MSITVRSVKKTVYRDQKLFVLAVKMFSKIGRKIKIEKFFELSTPHKFGPGIARNSAVRSDH